MVQAAPCGRSGGSAPLDPLPSPFSSLNIIFSTAMSSGSQGSDDDTDRANTFRWMSNTAAESDTSSISLRSSAGALALRSRGASGSETVIAAMPPRAAHGFLLTRPDARDSQSDTGSTTSSCAMPFSPFSSDFDQLLCSPRLVSLEIDDALVTAKLVGEDTNHEHCVIECH